MLWHSTRNQTPCVYHMGFVDDLQHSSSSEPRAIINLFKGTMCEERLWTLITQHCSIISVNYTTKQYKLIYSTFTNIMRKFLHKVDEWIHSFLDLPCNFQGEVEGSQVNCLEAFFIFLCYLLNQFHVREYQITLFILINQWLVNIPDYLPRHQVGWISIRLQGIWDWVALWTSQLPLSFQIRSLRTEMLVSL